MDSLLSSQGNEIITETSSFNIIAPNEVHNHMKAAYKQKNARKSKQLHIKKMKSYASNEYRNIEEEQHNLSEDFFYVHFKSIIYGGLDGIISLFAIVASIYGSNFHSGLVLVLGFAKLIADGLSMGLSGFFSEKAQVDFVKSELDREQWEFDNYLQGEIDEMMEIYQSKGITKDDAEIILNTMAKYPNLFIDHMMHQELDLNTKLFHRSPHKNGLVTFISFLCFGTVPLLAYIVFYGTNNNNDWSLTFVMIVILTCFTLFGMGAIKGYYRETHIIKTGIIPVLNGSFAAASAYCIAWAMSIALGVHN
eukprot:501466_1